MICSQLQVIMKVCILMCFILIPHYERNILTPDPVIARKHDVAMFFTLTENNAIDSLIKLILLENTSN